MTPLLLAAVSAGSAVHAEDARADETAGDVVPRVSVEMLSGVLGGFLGFLPGVALEDPATAAVGLLLGLPLGVSISGWIFDADGSYWWSLLGEIAGIAVLAAVIAAWDRDPGDAGFTAIPVTFGMPLAGAIVGFELSN